VDVVRWKKKENLTNRETTPSKELFGEIIYCSIYYRELKGWDKGCMVTPLCSNSHSIAITLANATILEDEGFKELETNPPFRFNEVSLGNKNGC